MRWMRAPVPVKPTIFCGERSPDLVAKRIWRPVPIYPRNGARPFPALKGSLRHRERSDAISLSFEPILNVLCVGQVPLLNLTSQKLAHRTFVNLSFRCQVGLRNLTYDF